MPHHLLRTCAAVAAGTLALVGIGAGPASAAVAPLGVVSEVTAGITAGSEPYDIVSGPDGNMWFTEPRLNKVARMTTRGAVTELTSQIPANVGPLHLTVGSDGNLWFSEAYKNQLARLTTGGVVTEFTAGGGTGRIGEMTAGPDGNVWYVKSRAIGRMTPAGEVTEFSAGLAADARIGEIAAGPDGNLWFAEYQGGRVGRVTPSGQITEFATGLDPELSLLDIAAGPDGTMWFTADDEQLRRIATDGVVSTLPHTGVRGAFTTLPDGSVWYIAGGGRVGRIASNGAVRTFGGGFTNGPADLALGPDGNLWFTDTTGDLAGRIGTGAVLTMTCVEKGGVTKPRLKVVCRTTGLGAAPTVRWKVARKDSGSLVARGRKALVGGKLVMNLSRADARQGRHRVTVTRGSGIDKVVVTRVLRLT
ncbi:MAG: hypothetical protein ABI807_08785 [Sporichthyaceae bacterium]